ncbi:MAG: hypothetical protein LBK56_14555 [Gracilibacteraceae bacterium]|jgi:predicted nucleic acid-binding protein|nr:hypothetical protein [Gracilibacteraceae bacterium]
MRKSVVVNSTPVIALLQIGRMDILKELYGEIVIPVAVRDEIVTKNTRALHTYEWLLKRWRE